MFCLLLTHSTCKVFLLVLHLLWTQQAGEDERMWEWVGLEVGNVLKLSQMDRGDSPGICVVFPAPSQTMGVGGSEWKGQISCERVLWFCG